MSDERGGKYLKEARFFLGGDKSVAQTHIGEARQLLGTLRDRLGIGGPAYLVDRITLKDGTEIRGVMNNGLFQAAIYSPSPGEEVVIDECNPFWSGLYHPLQSANHNYVNAAGKSSQYIGVEWFYPSAYQMTVTPKLFERFPDNPDAAALAIYPKKNPPELTWGTYGLPPKTISSIYASSYSGEMRVAVQLLLGMGVDLMAGDIAPLYDYGYQGTIGLVKVPDTPADQPQFWMIRFPTGGYGVLAMKYPVCLELSDAQTAAGITYIPNPGISFPTDIAKAIKDKKVFEILPAATFNSLVGGYEPFYPDCGWAFSKSGHEAQNVLYSIADVGPGLFEVRTKQIKFSFTATKDKVVCEGAVVGSGVAHANGDPGMPPRYPMPDGTLLSFIEMSYPTPSSSTSGPVHVYYIGDEAQVWTLHSIYNSDPKHESNPAPPTQNVPCPDEYGTRDWNAGSIETWYELNGHAVTSKSTGTYSETKTAYVTQPYAPLAPYWFFRNEANGITFTKLEPYQIWKKSWTENGTSVTARGTIFIPNLQREGVTVLDIAEKQTTAHNVFWTYKNVPFTGDGWTSFSQHLDGIYELRSHDPAFVRGINACPLPFDGSGLDGVVSGGSYASGYDGPVTIYDFGVTMPSPSEYAETPGDENTYNTAVTFYGATVVPLENPTLAHAYGYFAPAGEDNPQWMRAYTDALEPEDYILSSVNPISWSDFTTNMPYHLPDTPAISYNLIGIP